MAGLVAHEVASGTACQCRAQAALTFGSIRVERSIRILTWVPLGLWVVRVVGILLLAVRGSLLRGVLAAVSTLLALALFASTMGTISIIERGSERCSRTSIQPGLEDCSHRKRHIGPLAVHAGIHQLAEGHSCRRRRRECRTIVGAVDILAGHSPRLVVHSLDCGRTARLAVGSPGRLEVGRCSEGGIGCIDPTWRQE